MNNQFGTGVIYGLSFQNGVSPVMSETIKFHDENMLVLIVIACLVAGSIILVWCNSFSSLEFIDSKVMEILWTLLPIFILVTLALPSLELLYFLDCPKDIDGVATIRATGMQWYWNYDITYELTGAKFNFDSYILDSNSNEKGYRLLEVDNPAFAPRGEVVKLVVSGGDVIHSFAVPSLGVKLDGVPGRMNEGGFIALKLGSYYGQCSEICGANHSFMPINIEVIPIKAFAEGFNSAINPNILLIINQSSHSSYTLNG
uniref:Cytochrome c oxidase subunit 2 n=1 Tax=Eurylepta cornuta TaxID=1879303 RepID=A0A2R3SK54_9PLAT|nr:cytochrome c oxidase subunit II [Eurylepta cornuta]